MSNDIVHNDFDSKTSYSNIFVCQITFSLFIALDHTFLIQTIGLNNKIRQENLLTFSAQLLAADRA